MALYYHFQSLWDLETHVLFLPLIMLPSLLPLANKYRRKQLTISHIKTTSLRENRAYTPSSLCMTLPKMSPFWGRSRMCDVKYTSPTGVLLQQLHLRRCPHHTNTIKCVFG